MAKSTYSDPLAYSREQQREARAMRAEMKKKEEARPLIFDRVKEMAALMTPAELTKKFEKRFAGKPSALLHAHGMAAKAYKLIESNARGGEALKAKVAELKKLHPDMNLHEIYRRAGVAAGILS